MKKLYPLALLFGLLFSANSWAVDSFEVLQVSQNEFKFDYSTEYLNVNVVNLNPPSINVPSWWDRIWGKKTSYGLVYAEFGEGDEHKKIPLFSYSAKSDKNYEVDKVGVLNSSIVFPLIRRLPYDPDSNPNLKLSIRYWDDPKQADLIKEIISAGKLLGGMEVSTVDAALNISTIVVSLLEKLWPSDDKKNTVTLSLIKENISKDEVTFGYPGENNNPSVPVITIGFSKTAGYFIGKSFSEALNEYRPEKYAVWRGAIIEVDKNIGSTGLRPLQNQLEEYSKYISTLPLNYGDKVVLLAESIESWASNAVNGISAGSGVVHHMSMADYRRLENSDWRLLDKLTNDVLTKLKNAGNCTSSHCKTFADILSKSYSGLDVSI